MARFSCEALGRIAKESIWKSHFRPLVIESKNSARSATKCGGISSPRSAKAAKSVRCNVHNVIHEAAVKKGSRWTSSATSRAHHMTGRLLIAKGKPSCTLPLGWAKLQPSLTRAKLMFAFLTVCVASFIPEPSESDTAYW